MSAPRPRLEAPTPAPQPFRDALAEMVQIGLTVMRMLGQAAKAEAELAEAAAQIRAAEEDLPFPTSMAEAIETDRATMAAYEARKTVVERAETIAAAFAKVSRAYRMNVLLAERLDRGWARRGISDNRRAMARRQIARAVEDAIGREADGERAEQLTEALADRLESLDVENELADRPVEEIIRIICRDLGLDPARIAALAPLRGAAPPPNTRPTKKPTTADAPAPFVSGGLEWMSDPPPQPPPDIPPPWT